MAKIFHNEFGDTIWDRDVIHQKHVKSYNYGAAYQAPVFNIGETVEFCIAPNYTLKHRGVIQSKENKINPHSGNFVEAFYVLDNENVSHHLFYWSLYKINEEKALDKGGFDEDDFYGGF